MVGAEAAFRRADEAGNGLGAYGLGALLYRRDEVELAEAAYRRADQRGDAGGAVAWRSICCGEETLSVPSGR
jgi:hypothetical protein